MGSPICWRGCVECDVLEVDDVLRGAIDDLVNGDEVEGLEGVMRKGN